MAEVRCFNSGCRSYSPETINNCLRMQEFMREDFDIVTIGEDGKCENFTPTTAEEHNG
jgi:hypothetical protein